MHLSLTRFKTCFWQVIHNIVMDLEIPISETSVELINGVFGWGAEIFGKSAKHELTFNRWRLKRTWMTIFTKFHPPWENKENSQVQRRQSRSGVHQNSGVQWLMVVYWRRPTWRKCNSVWLYNRTLHHALLGTWTKRQTDRHTDRQKDGQINRDIQTDQKEYEGKSWNKLTRKHSYFFFR